ncbi:MAG: polyprenol monophosphomannose synthase [Thermoplasmata archaeon]|nr:polyprenol monophosphomannose synthase [Thermoplasmata archaeon]
MQSAPAVSVILPTYNERESLRLLAPRLLAALTPYSSEILVVDDDSPDGTGALVEELAHSGPFRRLRRPGRLGLASAVLEGFSKARGRVLVVMDADGSHPPETIPSLVEPILSGDAEFVLASRKLPGGSSPGLRGTRKAISWIASSLARPLTSVSDPMSGFFAVARPVLDRARLTPLGFKIALEVLVKCRPGPLVEVPFCFESRVAGNSKLDRRQIGGFIRHLWRLYVWRASGRVSGRASSTR